MLAPILERLSARDSLIACHSDYAAARHASQWPCHSEFNFAIDGFRTVATPNRGEQGVVRIVQSDGAKDGLINDASSARSSIVASFQRDAWHQHVDAGLLPNECWADKSVEPFAEIAS